MKRTSKKSKAAWERGYNGHVYWLGKQKLGKVTLLQGHFITPHGKYKWEAASRAGAAEDLDKAKQAVELAVAMADKQLDLFQ